MKFNFFLLFIIQSVNATIHDCDTSSIFRPTILTLSPDPPLPDKTVYLSLVFDNPETIVTNGTVTKVITINGLPYTESKALCDDTQCPIVTGSNNRSTETIWPSSVTGKIVSKFTWTGTNSESLLCIEITVKVLNPLGFAPIFRHPKPLSKTQNSPKKLY